MKLTDLERVQGLIEDLKRKADRLENLNRTSDIHVSIVTGFKTSDHMNFTSTTLSSGRDIEPIRDFLSEMLKAEKAKIEKDLLDFGINIENG